MCSTSIRMTWHNINVMTSLIGHLPRLVQLGLDTSEATHSQERIYDSSIYELNLTLMGQRLASAAIDWFPSILPIDGLDEPVNRRSICHGCQQEFKQWQPSELD